MGRPLRSYSVSVQAIVVLLWGVALVGTVQSVTSLSFPCRGLCAAACAHHPAAVSLGLWPGLLQDGASVSIHTCCGSGMKQEITRMGASICMGWLCLNPRRGPVIFEIRTKGGSGCPSVFPQVIPGSLGWTKKAQVFRLGSCASSPPRIAAHWDTA